MNIPEATVLAHGWTKQIQTVKEQVVPLQSIAITPTQSAAVTMQERAERNVYRMAGVTDKVLPHLKSMQPDSILDRVNDIEKYDRLARRNYGVSDNQTESGILNLNVLAGRSGALIAIDQQPGQTPSQEKP